MKFLLKGLVLVIFFVAVVNGQNKSGAKMILLPSTQDSAEAKARNLNTFKILPRGMFDFEENEILIRGGGAYYSFSKQSHSYNDTPQIELQQNYLAVGFSGVNYGFIADLGEISPDQITVKNAKTNFLLDYKPPISEPDARVEQRKAHDYRTGNLAFKRSIPAIVGHTYVLRAISFDNADVLVAFQIYRQEADDSLVIFWKLIEQFEKPALIRPT